MIRLKIPLLATLNLFSALIAGFIISSDLAAQTEDPLVLARVEVITQTVIDLPTYASLQDAGKGDYLLVIAPIERLRSSHLAYRILDWQVTRASDYVVALERRAGARAQASRSFSILHDDGRQIVVRLPFDQADALAKLGFNLNRLSDKPNSSRVLPLLWVQAAAMPDPAVASLLDRIQQTAVYDYTGQLSGELAVLISGTPFTITTRHTNSGLPIQKATEYLYEKFRALGLSVHYHNWIACNLSNRNVIGEKRGSVRPDEIILITAHLDDLPSSGTTPGADDNASGSVGVWLTAETLRSNLFQRTVRFVFFTGEEQGTCGSQKYAELLNDLNENVVAVFNMDMIGWDAIKGPTLRLYTRTPTNPGYPGDRAIADTFVNVVNAYGLDGSLTPIISPTGLSGSDHSAFWNQGYPAVLAIEDDLNDFDTQYHAPDDRLQFLNLTYFTNFIKAAVGTIAHLALLENNRVYLPLILSF